MTEALDPSGSALASQLEAAAREVADKEQVAARIDARFMLARVFAFASSVAGFLLTAATRDDRWGWYLMIPGALAFVALVIVHRPRRRELHRIRRLAQLIARKRERITGPERPPLGDALARRPDALQE
ncbi:MAG: hypothetical protein KDB18_13580, partial [Salinibacterium sp.]|nr:hypothetical protein [Salinibacterium sp.]